MSQITYPHKIRVENAYIMARNENHFEIYGQADKAPLSRSELKKLWSEIGNLLDATDENGKRTAADKSADKPAEKPAAKAPETAPAASKPAEPAKTKAEAKPAHKAKSKK